MKVTSRSSTSRGLELLAPPDHQPVRGRVDLQHVPGTGLAQVSEPAALADRVDGGAAMRPELAAGRVDDGAGVDRQPLAQVAGGLAARNEADLLLSALSATGRPNSRACSRTSRLFIPPSGKTMRARRSRSR